MVAVSICIPSYNASGFIYQTIQSILDSTYPDFEIIVNDDGSTDNTIEIVESFHDSRISLFRNIENSGPVSNWNLAIKKARGKYAGLLNHDDLYDPFWLSFAIHNLEKFPHIGWAATAYNVVDEAGQVIEVVSCFPETREYSCEEAFRYLTRLDSLGPGFIARREILEEIGYYDEDAGYGADNDLFVRLSIKYPLLYSNYPHASSRSHSRNLTYLWDKSQQALEGIRVLNKVFIESDLPEALKKNKKACYVYFFNKMLNHARIASSQGDITTAQLLIQILLSELGRYRIEDLLS